MPIYWLSISLKPFLPAIQEAERSLLAYWQRTSWPRTARQAIFDFASLLDRRLSDEDFLLLARVLVVAYPFSSEWPFSQEEMRCALAPTREELQEAMQRWIHLSNNDERGPSSPLCQKARLNPDF